MLHRDIKPHNIFVSQYGEPALGDFGISTLDDERSHSGASGLSVAYAAPEILEDAKAEVTSDVYSLAATLYHLVAGSSPFASNELRTTVRRILTETPAAIARPDSPPGLSRVLIRTMSKDPADRPASAYEFAEMLREVQARAGLELTPIPATQGDGAESVVSPAPVVPPSPNGAGTPLCPCATNRVAATSSSRRRRRSIAVPSRAGLAAPHRTLFRRRQRIGHAHRRTSADDASGHRRRRRPTPRQAAGMVGGRGSARRRAAAGVRCARFRRQRRRRFARHHRARDARHRPRLGVPTNVKVLRAENGFNVHFELPKSADGARIQLLSTSRQGETIEAPTSPHLVRVDASSLCVQVIATRTDGRISGASQTACSGG